jgi:predicted amidophosphoribosyltransferase
MQVVTSRDGSRIAYDRFGSGPAVILVSGALGYRKFKKMEELAKLLAERCTVINYDRRARPARGGHRNRRRAALRLRGAVHGHSRGQTTDPGLRRAA